MGGEGGVSEIFVILQSYSFGHLGPHAKFQNRSFTPSGLYMKIGSTDSGGYVKFTPKCIITGCEGGVSEMLQTYSVGHLGPHGAIFG